MLRLDKKDISVVSKHPLVFFGVGLVIFFLILNYFSSILIPLLIPVLLAYLLFPIISFLEKFSIPRWLGALILLASIIAGFLFLLGYLLPILFSELQNVFTYLPKMEQELKGLNVKLNDAFPIVNWNNVQAELSGYLKQMVTGLISSIPDILQNIFILIYFLIIIPFLFFFFLKDGRKFIKMGIKLIPNRYFEAVVNLLYEIDSMVGRFLRGIVIENFSVAILAIVGLSVIGMQNAVLTGTLVGLFNVIPYMGPAIGLILTFVTVLIEPVGNPSFFQVLIVISAVQLIDNVFLYPLAVGKSVDIHPVLVICSLLFGGFFFSLFGMLLAVPVVTSILIIYKTYKHIKIDYRV